MGDSGSYSYADGTKLTTSDGKDTTNKIDNAYVQFDSLGSDPILKNTMLKIGRFGHDFKDIGQRLLQAHFRQQELAHLRFGEKQGGDAGKALLVLGVRGLAGHGRHLNGNLQLAVFLDQRSGGFVCHDVSPF